MNNRPGSQDQPDRNPGTSFPQLNPNPIVGVDSSGHVTFLNDGAKRALESVGKGAAPDLFLPRDMDEILAALKRRERTTFRREVTVGDLVFDESIYIAPEDDAVGIYATDITERKRTEQALRESEERFRQAFDYAVVGKMLTAPGGRLLRVNAAFGSMLGYYTTELQALNVADVTHPDDVALSREAERTLLDGDQRVARFEKRFLHKNGAVVWADVGTFLLRDPQGQAAFLITHALDITERKRSDKQKERLAREVEQKKAELEQLVYAASHDLRTPLVSVEGFVGELRRSLADLLAELNRDDVPPEIRKRVEELTGTDIPESLKFIGAGVTRMSELVSGLLRLSRLDRATFEAESLDMNRVVGEVVRSLEFAAREADAKVDIEDLPACVGDPVQVGQVLSNLIENALEHRSPERNPVVRVSGRREDGTTVYCVEDNGCGIAPDQQQHVFTPFFRVDEKNPSGEGLGLTIVARILRRLGGQVWVESELGKGSRFYVKLPTG